MRHLIAIVTVLLIMVSCTDDTAQTAHEGNEGEACFENNTCNDALECISDLCVAPDITPGCGDGFIAGSEVCDGSNMGSNTCVSLGFEGGGELECSPICTVIDTSNCFAHKCENGVIDDDEECDGNDTVDATCGEFDKYTGTVTCNSDCTLNGDDCEGECGDGVIDIGFEECDGNDNLDLDNFPGCHDFWYELNGSNKIDGGEGCWYNCKIDYRYCDS